MESFLSEVAGLGLGIFQNSFLIEHLATYFQNCIE